MTHIVTKSEQDRSWYATQSSRMVGQAKRHCTWQKQLFITATHNVNLQP